MAKVTFDSCFLIDLERERAGRKLSTQVRPSKFLETNSAVQLAISPVALAEFAVGFPDQNHPVRLAVITNFELLQSSQQTALTYAAIYRELSSRSELIGTNDMWIAAYSLVHRLPLVTNNTREFVRIPGLELLSY